MSDPKIVVDLNPDGFPQDNGTLPPTFDESLDDKPRCQKDYALKWGLAFAAKTDYGFIGKAPYRSPLPFQLQGDYAQIGPWLTTSSMPICIILRISRSARCCRLLMTMVLPIIPSSFSCPTMAK